MGRLARVMRHLFAGGFQLGRCFPSSLLDELAGAIGAGERRHRGELRFAVEARLPPLDAWSGLTARARAEDLFARLRVWDTELNTGVLVYVLLAEHRIEIVADRGLAARVPPEDWSLVAALMRKAYAAGQWREGSLAGIRALHELAERHVPATDGAVNPDELPDPPVVL